MLSDVRTTRKTAGQIQEELEQLYLGNIIDWNNKVGLRLLGKVIGHLLNNIIEKEYFFCESLKCLEFFSHVIFFTCEK